MLNETVKQRIQEALPDAEICIKGEACSLEALVISAAFAGKGRIQQHRLVLDTVKDLIASGELHALSVATHAPEDWAERGSG
ncbi:MAG: BolA/IbaG family iron-sulfur metabolism protein [Gammaproteobacteria bacterium]|nr:BolA/IbaG family iron-sulfur metabolism protein [Gammaproteobacteria bacterium]MBU1654934.1 BolA/IbaG family iron-sulfur metabolism protein [Gammaproteobacteria bacterium]MBU1962389.1 BolA/IbaG family iron-sulfur metabolism protein [Gammaproteobacteria bacterium]